MHTAMYKVDVASDRRRRENVPRHILCSMERGKMQKYMQKKRIFPACLFLMFVLMILVIGKETDMTGRGETQKIRNLSDGWYYLRYGSSYLGSTISPADPDGWKNNLSVS